MCPGLFMRSGFAGTEGVTGQLSACVREEHLAAGGDDGVLEDFMCDGAYQVLGCVEDGI